MKALSFGELLWDIIDGTPYIGGAPFNLAAHLAQMGADVSMITAVGEDELGKRALNAASGYGVRTDYIRSLRDKPTGTVDVFLDKKGIPDYTIHQNVAWDDISLDADDLERINSGQWDVLCFGTLAQRGAGNRALLGRIVPAAGPRHIFYDVNLRQSFYDKAWIETSLDYSTIVKLNEEEAEALSGLLFGEPESTRDFAVGLAEAFALEVVLVTRGPEGALVYDGEDFAVSPTQDVEVVDTVGAGDSFSAGFLFAYLSGNDAFAAANTAAAVADYVVSKHGAVPDYSTALEELLRSRRPGAE